MQVVITLIGLPGSGKSTIAHLLCNKNFKFCGKTDYDIISSDEIRKELFGDEKDQSNNGAVFIKYYQKMEWALKSGKSVILDSTNINIKNRKGIFETLKRIGLKQPTQIKVVALVVDTPIEIVLSQDSSRDRVVGKDVINRYTKMYEHPQLYEGFDYITLWSYITQPVFESDFALVKSVAKQMDEFDQKNPHHLYKLGEHCRRLAEQYAPVDLVQKHAAKWHDVGKLFTQFMDEKGIAHYYGHPNYGTYFLMSHWKDFFPNLYIDDINKILFYVNFHMCKFFLTSEKAIEKWKNIWGEELFEKLIEFGNYDILASGTK